MTFRSDDDASGQRPTSPPSRTIFIDESGVLATTAGAGRTFVLVAISTNAPKALQRRMKRQKASLIKAGWPRRIEIKGNHLWRAPHDRRIPMEISSRHTEILLELLAEIATAPAWIRASILSKEALTRAEVVDFEMVFNTMAAKLIAASSANSLRDLHVIVDQRSKEPKNHERFRVSIERELSSIHSASLDTLSLNIEHLDSQRSVGLQAVDVVAWALYRAYEHGDSRFRDALPALQIVEHPWS